MKYLNIGHKHSLDENSYIYIQIAKFFVSIFIGLSILFFLKENVYTRFIPELCFLISTFSLISIFLYKSTLISKTKIPFIFSTIELVLMCWAIKSASYEFSTVFFWGFAIIATNYFFTSILFSVLCSLSFSGFFLVNNIFYKSSFLIDYTNDQYTLLFTISVLSFGIYNFVIFYLLEKSRRESMSEMQKLLKYNESLVNSLPCFVSWVDYDYKYMGVNKNMCDFFETSESSFIGQKVGEVNESQQSDLKSIITEFNNSNDRSYQGKFSYKYKNQEFHTVLSLVKYEEGILIVTFDITKVIEAENLIDFERARANTSARLASFGEVSAGIAHEINSPLAIISALSFKLNRLMKKDEVSHDFLKEFAFKVDHQVIHISKIVKSIRALSRDGSNDKFEAVDLKDIINDVLVLVNNKCMQNNINLILPEPEELEVDLECQGVQLGQVLIIFFNNSIDAIRDLPNKWIRLSINNLNEDNIELIIEDAGHGISPIIAKDIFKPFFTTKDVGSGTGLGLSLAEKIIKRHNGDVKYIDSAKHTKFSIYLPRLQSKSGKIAS